MAPHRCVALEDSGAGAYAARARAKGDDIEVTTIPGAGHFDVINPQSKAWPTVRDLLVSLVKRPD